MKRTFPAHYTTLGEEYEYLTDELLKVKNGFQVTETWEMPYFSRFLYDTFPPPDKDTPPIDASGGKRDRRGPTSEQLEMGEFVKLLGELQRKRKISGQQFMEYRDQWSKQPLERDALNERLKRLLAV